MSTARKEASEGDGKVAEEEDSKQASNDVLIDETVLCKARQSTSQAKGEKKKDLGNISEVG